MAHLHAFSMHHMLSVTARPGCPSTTYNTYAVAFHATCSAEHVDMRGQTTFPKRHMHINAQVIPAIEEAIVGMKVGGVRRLIVPQELGYPGQPPDFTKQGPTPGNFSVSPNLHLCL